jgi:hypothetical protein
MTRAAPVAIGSVAMNLVLLVCLAGSPDTCHEERMLIGASLGDARMCLASAVPAIAEWSEEHPGYMISRWKCGDAREALLAH